MGRREEAQAKAAEFKCIFIQSNMNLNLKLLSVQLSGYSCHALSSPELSQSDIHSRTQSRTRQAANVAGEAVTIVEKPF